MRRAESGSQVHRKTLTPEEREGKTTGMSREFYRNPKEYCMFTWTNIDIEFSDPMETQLPTLPNRSAHYTYVYTTAIKKLRMKSYKQSDKGVPLEYFCWERVIVDEIHESLCTSKGEMNAAKEAAKERDSIGFFREKNRRAGRELMGITEKNLAERPLRFR